jgi:hypothetical protein
LGYAGELGGDFSSLYEFMMLKLGSALILHGTSEIQSSIFRHLKEEVSPNAAGNHSDLARRRDQDLAHLEEN